MLAAYVLALGSGLITGGRVGDSHGRRTVFLVSPGCFAAASAACALAPGAGALIAVRAVQGREWGWPVWGWVVLAAGLALLVLFVVDERAVARRDGQPILDPALLAVRPFTAGLLASVLFFGALASFSLVLPIYLQDGTGRSAWDTGLVILPYAVGSIVTSGVGSPWPPKPAALSPR